MTNNLSFPPPIVLPPKIFFSLCLKTAIIPFEPIPERWYRNVCERSCRCYLAVCFPFALAQTGWLWICNLSELGGIVHIFSSPFSRILQTVCTLFVPSLLYTTLIFFVIGSLVVFGMFINMSESYQHHFTWKNV